MLVRPPHLALGELICIRGTRRWVRDLRDQVRRRRFRDAVDQNPEERDLEEDVEADAEAEEEAFAVVEPEAFLRWGHTDAREVGFELWSGDVSERELRGERREPSRYQFSH